MMVKELLEVITIIFGVPERTSRHRSWIYEFTWETLFSFFSVLFVIVIIRSTSSVHIDILVEYGIAAYVAVMGFVFVRAAKLLSTYRANKELFVHIKSKIGDHPLRDYVYEEINRINDEILIGIRRGIDIKQENLEPFVRAFFHSGKGEYTGIESNLPSTYYKIYDTYLQNHEDYVKHKKEKEKGQRILICKDWGEIYNDAQKTPTKYQEFLHWHDDNKVKLMWVAKNAAGELCKGAGLKTTDIGFWANSFAVTFSPNRDDTINVKLIDKDDRLFGKIRDYVNCMVRDAEPIEESKLPIFSKSIVEVWEGYVGDRKKRENSLGKLLIHELEAFNNFSGRILDAAPGIGYEAEFLYKNRFDVAVNEADPGFKDIIQGTMGKLDKRIPVYDYDWRNLSKNLLPIYKGVLVLGNSICMVMDPEERKKCIGEFYKIITPGGKLIIDERNFSLIKAKFENKERYCGNGIMYAGDKINCKLSRANSHLVSFEFFEVDRQDDDPKIIGTVVVDELEHGELMSILNEAGFKDVRIYSDLIEGENENADFFTYVATKL